MHPPLIHNGRQRRPLGHFRSLKLAFYREGCLKPKDNIMWVVMRIKADFTAILGRVAKKDTEVIQCLLQRERKNFCYGHIQAH